MFTKCVLLYTSRVSRARDVCGLSHTFKRQYMYMVESRARDSTCIWYRETLRVYGILCARDTACIWWNHAREMLCVHGIERRYIYAI